MRNVLVVDDGNEARDVEAMFKSEGYELVTDIYDADLVVFVGGEDVNPSLYNQRRHHTTYYNIERDTLEVDVYNEARALGIPMAGICRGGQLLNVLNGGKLWQDVNGHNSGRHKAWIVGHAGLPVEVTSVHHQMMEPDHFSDVKILLKAAEATKKINMSDISTVMPSVYERYPDIKEYTDVEACYYPASNCLCFQPHPEYGHKETKEVFFQFLNTYSFMKEN